MLLYPPKGLNFTTREKCFIEIYQKMSKFKRITKMLCEKCNIDMMYSRGRRLLVKKNKNKALRNHLSKAYSSKSRNRLEFLCLPEFQSNHTLR